MQKQSRLWHIYVDSSQDDELRALYLQKLISKIGHESKLIRYISTVSTNSDGKFFDSDGLEIKLVWKVCEWENALHDYENPRDGASIKISDLLLSKELKVIEPLWMMIMSSPALLPVMWEMFPDHAMLLRAECNAYDYF